MAILHTAHLRIRPDSTKLFRERLSRHARTSVEAEPGCCRFDFYQERGDPGLFLLIEVYADDAALETHRTSSHYLAFREDVKDWVEERSWWYWQCGTEAD